MPAKKFKSKSAIQKKLILGFGGFAALAVAIGVTATAIQKPTADPRSFASEDAIHRLQVRRGDDGSGEFYDIETGKPVILRGNTYQRIAWGKTSTGKDYRYHSNFMPGLYNHDESANALKLMHSFGYNSVRVFINKDGISTKTNKIDPVYIKNLVDFIQLSKQNNIYVLIVIAGLPGNANYFPAAITPWEKGSYNVLLLNPEVVNAKVQFMKDMVSALKDKGAPMDAIMGYSVENEVGFTTTAYPWRINGEENKGAVKTTTGTYAMTDPNAVNKMMEDGLKYFMNTVRAGVRSVDPQALVSISFLNPKHQENSQDVLLTVGAVKAITTYSNADFSDVHIYPKFGFTTKDEMTSYGYAPGSKPAKPIIMGEYGAYGAWSYIDDNGRPIRQTQTINQGAELLKDLQVVTCKDYNFKGWYVYDWDTSNQEYVGDTGKTYNIFNVVRDENDDLYPPAKQHLAPLNRALAPMFRPDPCLSSAPTPTPTSTPTFTPTSTPVSTPKTALTVSVQCGTNKVSDQCISRDGNLTLNVTNTSDKVMYAIWNEENGLDDMKKYSGIKTSSEWSATVGTGSHPGSGPIVSNIWKYTNGNQEWCSKVTVPICK